MVQLITLKNGLFDCFPGEEGVSVLQMTVEGGLDQGVEVEDQKDLGTVINWIWLRYWSKVTPRFLACVIGRQKNGQTSLIYFLFFTISYARKSILYVCNLKNNSNKNGPCWCGSVD